MEMLVSTGLLIALIDPSDVDGIKFYPSGIKEQDKYHLNRWPSSNNPLLRIPYHFLNEKYELLSPGVYDAAIEQNKIVLYQGNQIKATFSVAVEETNKHIEIPKAFAKKESGFTIITVFKDGQKASVKLHSPR